MPYFSFCSDNRGINAAENAPSAKNLLKRLGILKAIKNASATGPDPKIDANKMSRIKPITLLNKVHALTTTLDL